jgi:hypothetical protein
MNYVVNRARLIAGERYVSGTYEPADAPLLGEPGDLYVNRVYGRFLEEAHGQLLAYIHADDAVAQAQLKVLLERAKLDLVQPPRPKAQKPLGTFVGEFFRGIRRKNDG